MSLVVGEILGSCHSTMSTLALDSSRTSFMMEVGSSVDITSKLCDQTRSLSRVCGSVIRIVCFSKWWAFVIVRHIELISFPVNSRFLLTSDSNRWLLLWVDGELVRVVVGTDCIDDGSGAPPRRRRTRNKVDSFRIL